MLELAMLLFFLALLLAAVDLAARILHFFFPSVKLFKQLQIRDWKWPGSK
jgi:hypothetical protein